MNIDFDHLIISIKINKIVNFITETRILRFHLKNKLDN